MGGLRGGGDGGVRGRGRGERGGAFETCQRVRHEMAFLVNNWLTYLQVDVVEAQYQTMVDRVAAADDFAEARRAHRSFLAALTAQSFLDLASVSSIVEVIMQLSSSLCAAVANLPSDGSPPSADVLAEVEAIGVSFARQSTSLYTILRSNRLANDPKAPYLRQLLLRLNFNDYFFEAARRHVHGGGETAPPSVSSSISISSTKSFRGGWQDGGGYGQTVSGGGGGGGVMGPGVPPQTLSLKRG